MKFATITPTRGDRPEFLQQCRKLISKQTLQPTDIIFMDYKPESKKRDLTQRYRRGIEEATRRGCECAVFWEDDDYYHPLYLNWLINEWKKANKPVYFGVGETYYYHLGAKARLRMKHPNRTSAFCTLVKLPFRGDWPADHDPYLDMHLHKTGNVKTVEFRDIYAIGIKHGIGMIGGGGHSPRFKWDMMGDKAYSWFKKHCVDEMEFYDMMAKKIGDSSSTAQEWKKYKRTGKHPGAYYPPNAKPKSKNARTKRKEIIRADSGTQLRRRGRKIIKIHKR